MFRKQNSLSKWIWQILFWESNKRKYVITRHVIVFVSLMFLVFKQLINCALGTLKYELLWTYCKKNTFYFLNYCVGFANKYSQIRWIFRLLLISYFKSRINWNSVLKISFCHFPDWELLHYWSPEVVDTCTWRGYFTSQNLLGQFNVGTMVTLLFC